MQSVDTKIQDTAVSATKRVKFIVRLVQWAGDPGIECVKWHVSKETDQHYFVIRNDADFQVLSKTTSANTWRKLFSNWGLLAVSKSSPEYFRHGSAQYWHPAVDMNTNAQELQLLQRRQDVNVKSNQAKKKGQNQSDLLPGFCEVVQVVKTKREMAREKDGQEKHKKAKHDK
jgi:hypothetical protein